MKKPGKNRQRRLKPMSFFLALALFISLFGGFYYFKENIGFASLQSESGTITELNIYQKAQSYSWNGYYGVAIMVAGYSSPQDELAYQGGMLEKNLLFSCLPPNSGQSIFASMVELGSLNISALRPATIQEVDAYLNYNGWEPDSTNQTFRKNISVKLGNNTINNVPATYTYQPSNPASTVYDLGILMDPSTNNIVMSTHVASFETGFNGRTYNYQMFVPVKNGTTPRYYFWIDPENNCPGGLGQEVSNATIRGFVRDNETLQPVDYAVVSAGGSSAYTDSSGYYTFLVPAGNHIIIAQKNGYDTYIGNFSILNGELLEYNITMSKSSNKVGNGTGTGVGPGIGPGVGTGVGSGIGTGTGTGVGPGIGEGTGPGVDVGPDFFPQSLLGIGPGIGPFVEKPKEIEGMDHWISLKEINTKLRMGNFLQDTVYMFKFGNGSANLEISVDDNLKGIVSIDNTKFNIAERGEANFTVTLYGNGEPGTYEGNIRIDGSFNETIKTKIQISPEEKMQVQSLLMDVVPARESETKGNIMKFKVDLKNLLIDEYYDVFLSYNITSLDGKSSFILPMDIVKLQTATTIVKSFVVPEVPVNDYMVKVYANYKGIRSYASAVFAIKEKFLMISIFGVRMWHILLFLFLVASGFIAYKIIKKRMDSKKRFHVQLEYNELPKPGPRSVYVGKIAETNVKAYFDIDKLTVHTIVAGSTGGGKSVSAQVLIEECLIKGVAVIVFDPTAQWSGMLRKNVNERMLGLYAQYGLNPKKDPRGFNGNVRQILSKNEVIDIRKYMKPGEIQILSLNKLDPVDVDVFVANSVREVFHAGFDESQNLRLLLVYDEVHRLLPKFGGAGLGFIQIERGCREFRKWGLGIILISQVLADFVGQIKANINTEIQMRTSDENDLERIKSKYGTEFLQSLVKSPVGSGMLVNPAFNRGRPYFIAFRPLLHSIARLSDKELSEYNKYNEIIDDLDFQIQQLEEEKIDVFDLKLELKLALDKLKTGNFNMVGIYLEGLGPQLKKHWEKLGKEPKKKVFETASEADLKAEMEKAKAEREKFEKEQAGQNAKTPGAAKPATTANASPSASTASTPNNPSTTNPSSSPASASSSATTASASAAPSASLPNIPQNNSSQPSSEAATAPATATTLSATSASAQTASTQAAAQPTTQTIQPTVQVTSQNVKDAIKATQAEIKPESKPEIKTDAKPEVKADIKADEKKEEGKTTA